MLTPKYGWLLCLLAILGGADAEDATSAPGPAPSEDRVGFPEDYAREFVVLRTVIRDEGAKVVTVYGNAAAAKITDKAQLPYPNGSVIVMETARSRQDDDGKPVRDGNGDVQKAAVLGLHVMRREKGFGKAYADKRSGEWEFVEYRADGSYITPPRESASCAECHLKAGAEKDFVYGGRLAD